MVFYCNKLQVKNKAEEEPDKQKKLQINQIDQDRKSTSQQQFFFW